MHRRFAFALAAVALLSFPWAPVQAGVSIRLGIGWPFGPPCHHYYGPRVYIAAPPVYVVPAAVPAPVYVQPAPAAVQVPATPVPVPAVPPPPVAPRGN
jgi:hypothetical protein